MNVNRQIAQHKARIALMKRNAFWGAIMLIVLVPLTVCAFVLNWHPLVCALLTLPTLGTIAHAAAPYTRIADHRRKLRELEAQKANEQA